MGEIHSMPPCVEMQCRAAAAMLEAMEAHRHAKLHVVLEHFNFEMQPLLDAFSAGSLNLRGLSEGAEAEGHDVLAYTPLLELTKRHSDHVALHAGFIPRSYARMVMRESLDVALAAAKSQDYVAADETCEASEGHYSFFESLLSGRNLHDPAAPPPSDHYRAMFPAQVIKDCAMAHKVSKLVTAASASGASASAEHDRYLVICGIGHSGYSYGVPERIFRAHPELEQQAYRVWSLMLPPTVDLDDPDATRTALHDAFGAAAGPSDQPPAAAPTPADLCLAFAELGEEAAPAATPSAEEAKAATAAAYNSVGETAHVGGDARRARAVMRRLGYSALQITHAGIDAPNFQGVGSPHGHASLAAGEAVLDMGSGLGIDSFIAAEAVGKGGTVVGIDIAAAEVRHASARAEDRGLAEGGRVRFVVGDLERVPLADGSVDAIISNGAFCLAPDKAAAFREVHRVLKPGGRFAVCMSAMRTTLDEAVHWPLCMRMFSDMASLEPACTAAGLSDVKVDDSDMAMAFPLYDEGGEEISPLEQQAQTQREEAQQVVRNRVHVGSKEFAHLERFDVNELCARVVVTGRKPGAA